MTVFIRCKQLWQIGIAIAATSSVIFSWNSAVAQIVPDNTLGAESSVVAPNVDIKGLQSDRIDGGAIRGANVFHSFQEFGVRDGRGAYFSNPAGIENIFSRVTGTNASNIFGKLGVLGNANLFLLNPNGIIFGPNASLDIGGSFVGSTANSLNFGNGKQFSATNPTAPPLLTVTVPLGVQFNQAQPSAIVNSGNLLAGTGQNLTLLGGTVASTGQLSAPGGQVAVAAVPGGSVVNLSPSAQLLNIETPSPVSSVGSSSLSELLTSVDEKSYSGLTVNGNGQVELAGSGLPVVDGDVVARNVTAQTATLTANHNLTLAESQIGTTGDLNLLAGDTVRVRDSVANPFVAKAGGNFTIRGDKGIDILALNHQQTPFVSGGNLSLISDGVISGDAHFASGGNFSILNLSGSGGNFVSLYDPIIRSNGDVEIGDYTGASLKIESAGNITTGAITINSPDTSAAIDVNDPDYPTLTNGKALILRAGNDTLSGSVQEPDPLNGASNVNYSSSRSSAGNLTIDGNIRSDNFATPFTVELKASGDIIAQDINTAGFSNQGGNISITASRNITTGNLDSFIDYREKGDGGDIKLDAGGEIIKTGRITTKSSNGVAGDVALTAAGNIRSGNIQASSNSSSGDPQAFSTITLNSSQGSVFLDRVQLSTTNTGSDYAGIIDIDAAKNVEITNSRAFDANRNPILGIISDGYFGITDIKAGGDVSITNSFLTAKTPDNLPRPGESTDPGSGDINITSENGKIEINNSDLSTSTESRFASAGNITLNAQGIISMNDNSNVENIVQPGAAGEVQDDFIPTITLKGSSINITENSKVNASTSGFGNGGNIDVNTRSLSLSNGAELRVNTNGQGDAGEINIKAEQLSLRSNSGLIGDVDPNGNGKGASINLDVTGEILLDGTGEKIAPSGESTRITVGILANEFRQRGRGTGGDITIKAGSLVLKNGAIIKSSTQGQGDAGNISVEKADLVDISGSVPENGLPSGFFTSTSTDGKAGDITVNTRIFRIADGAALSARTTGNGQGGTITVDASSFEAINGGQLVTTTSGSGPAGSIFVNATDQVTISGNDPNYLSRVAKFPNLKDPRLANKIEEGSASGLFANTKENSTGQGGDIRISIPMGSLSVTNGAELQALTQGRGNAGNVTINARDISFVGTSRDGQFPSAAFVRVDQNAVGKAGNIDITTGSLSITDGARLFADTQGQGNAGIIKINATGSVNISGSNSINGQPSGLFTSTSSRSTGAGGNITVGDDITKPNLFRISDGAVLFASTSNNQKAGNITVNANRFEAINGGQLITTTSSSGAAGTITVNADRRVTISGRDATFAERRSKLGSANNENIFTNLDTRRIVTQPETNSEVFSGFYVNSQESTSRAGDIVVNSPIVFLDNKGRLIADSGSSDGGNITLQNGNLLLLRRNSLISTTGGTERREGSGGNIKVDYPKGFVIAGFARNNDIAANAFRGAGGEVTINALGIVNIRALKKDELERQLRLPLNTSPEKLDPQNLLTNDITAISQVGGPILQGRVNLNAQDVEPTRGTIQLPEDLGDSSRLIAQSCPVGVQGAASRFVVTGRGGLPPNPGSALSTDTFLGSAANAPSGKNATASTSVPPQEAQGVEIGPRGEIILTARPSTLTPHTPWQRLTGCYGK